jgi:peptidoglycan/xylan/chitin deacetylase (PgdA/CDA1 family)
MRVLEKLASRLERTRRYLSGRVLILLYHRIADADSDPWQLAVTPRHFEEHLQVLRRDSRLLRLQDVGAAAEKGRLPRRGVVVTFDDGYADNLLTGKPLLEKYDVPATVFITTGYTDQDREFWWDELDRLFIQPGVLPGTLSLRVHGHQRSWELGDAALYDKRSHQHNQGWRASEIEDPTPRHSVYRSLWQIMHQMPENDRIHLRQDLLEWAGAGSSARESHRPLSRDEIADLANGGLIEIGCHTISHPQLSALSAESQVYEIRQSKIRLEEIVGHAVTGFAYPYGQECDYTAETISSVMEGGFDYACTTSVGAVEPGTDRFRLPRIQAQNIDGESFARVISEWFHG